MRGSRTLTSIINERDYLCFVIYIYILQNNHCTLSIKTYKPSSNSINLKAHQSKAKLFSLKYLSTLVLLKFLGHVESLKRLRRGLVSLLRLESSSEKLELLPSCRTTPSFSDGITGRRYPTSMDDDMKVRWRSLLESFHKWCLKIPFKFLKSVVKNRIWNSLDGIKGYLI